jgi:photosystem II stability/assembly factor-like uncharacterized protein
MPLHLPRAHRAAPCLLFAFAAANAFADTSSDDFGGMQWRLLGPFRAGWGTMAAGAADQPDTFWFGAAGGGVWKTVNAGATWQPVSEGLASAPVGAIAVAPSNANVVYAGMGHPEPRYDIAAGDGMYRSDDGGAHWRHAGLEATRHIGAILVSPSDADTLLVGALGHIFGANAERGVFRSTDGGRHWTHTLAIDAGTGVVDLAADPAQPDLVFAAAWQARNWPWLSYFTPIEGDGSAIWRSDDGGVHWRKLVGEGWPAGKLGRIGLGVTHLANGATRVYASIDSEKHGGLYRSDDGGAHWQRVNDAKAVSTWYMSRLTVAPDDPDTLYTIGQSIHKSTDAGKSFTIIKGSPGGDDYHHLLINPKHPERMVTASDQGTVVSVDGGHSWSDWYNQPTGQFYHLAADDRFPYWIYSGQQDSGTVAIASRSDYGALSFRDWHPVGGDERDYDLPDPEDASIVYGSGLGGRISRWDSRTGEVQNVSPWPVSSYGARGTDVKFRYTWFTPIAFSAKAPYALYAGAQVLFRSTDRGANWQPISADLTGKRDGAKGCTGDVPVARASACGYGVIFSIAPSPRDNDELWIGTDNGRIHLTRDGGAHWSDITPKAVPDWGKVSSLDVSALDAGTAYAAIDNHRQDDFAPRILRTHDYGESWSSIVDGLPRDHFVSVVRADPQRAGLLYAGTDIGVYVSLDDGVHWQALQQNLPVAWVRDLLVHGNDLIAATQGRAIWLLDDVAPLRQMAEARAHDGAFLFSPSPAYRLRRSQNRDTPPPAETPLGTNPPDGTILDYRLPHAAKGAVAIEIRDAQGTLVRRFASDASSPWRSSERYFAEEWLKPDARPAAQAGAHRFVWNLRAVRPHAIGYDYSIAAVHGEDTSLTPAGMKVPPGRYDVALVVDGTTLHAPLEVKADPRSPASADDLHAATVFATGLATSLDRAYLAYGELQVLRAQLDALRKGDGALAGNARKPIDALYAATTPLVSDASADKPGIATVSGVLSTLYTDVESADRVPTTAQRAVQADYDARLDALLQRWQALRESDLSKVDAQLAAAGRPAIRLPTTDEIRLEGAGEAKDLP